MELPVEHLQTFAVIIEEGSFEGAARRLHITPSAVSQRVRAMEQRTGSVLLRRTRPVTTTSAGATVLRAARQIAQIVSDVATELEPGPAGGTLIPIVVNADSLATWFVPALARAARETGARFEVLRADETMSTEKLRSGEVMAALTATAEAVPGCTSTSIGADHYRAVASPAFVAEHFAAGVTGESLAAAPIVEFDRHDAFQSRFIRQHTSAAIAPPRHFVPSSTEFAHAIELGMGWGMLPQLQCAPGLATGVLVALGHEPAIALPLYWQRWNLRSPVLDTLSTIIAEEAAAALG
ncbi:LysR family transcriptional regulator (chromosome initiation inhibitor) [Leucobacter exalbidus]|uniref:LysR family transcriptional regulator (Chromosome initiation inhibitor) n=1 Tax=Leucobacter exalbidus TaxID=662960 RepID=A0A940T4B7_9MICO|nr:LysR family transcriptional regulator ArgP [Leucobacter exalbidus]MBP1326669.1 LysR family transcriptional regulator (chromosome initiation inhibitor) [Leucobacter exalbidus]